MLHRGHTKSWKVKYHAPRIASGIGAYKNRSLPRIVKGGRGFHKCTSLFIATRLIRGRQCSQELCTELEGARLRCCK